MNTSRLPLPALLGGWGRGEGGGPASAVVVVFSEEGEPVGKEPEKTAKYSVCV